MKDMKYHAPVTLEEALGLLAEYGDRATVLSGGTDLTPKINYYRFSPEILIYVGGIGLSYIKEEGGTILIGAATSTADLAASALLKEKAAALYQAAGLSGSEAIRTSATIGGNLANASPAADLATPLLAMDADLVLASASGERTLPVGDFFQGPGETVLKSDELIKEIRVPVPKGKTLFAKLGRRKAQTLSVMNVALQLTMDGEKVDSARIALGAMASKPIRCASAEAVLAGKKPDASLIAECSDKAISETSPIDDQRASAWYRRQAGRAVVSRALAQAAGLGG